MGTLSESKVGAEEGAASRPGWNGVGEGETKGSEVDFGLGEDAQEEAVTRINKLNAIQE